MKVNLKFEDKISGEIGGGYITFGTMVMLAKNDESHLVRAAFPIIPMISDYGFSDTSAMTVEEGATVKLGITLMWKYIAQVQPRIIYIGW